MVWFGIARLILRQRLPLLGLVLALTCLMGWQATKVKMSYQGNRLIPESDTAYKVYQDFCQRFGVDGNVMVVGVSVPSVADPAFAREWSQLARSIRQIPGIAKAYTVADLPLLVRNDSLRAFEYQERLGPNGWISGGDRFENAYERLLVNPQTSTALMAVALDPATLDDSRRIEVVSAVEKRTSAYSVASGNTVYLSGLPYIRTVMATRIKDELIWFLVASVVVTGMVLFLFFRSFQTVLLSLTLVGYSITLISGLIPALMVVIGVPNGVYLVNKYHNEYRKHGNKVKALTRIVERIGVATLITNATTAVGFFVFYFTESVILREFGFVTGLSVMVMFVLSIVVIPAILSLLPAPGFRQIRHLENQRIRRWLERLTRWIEYRRRVVVAATVGLLVVAISGILQLRTNSYVVDDLPRNDHVYRDLRFLEKHFGGVMPLDLVLDAGRPNGAQSPALLQKADQIQNLLEQQPIFGPPISMVELIKAANQAYFGGSQAHYQLPNAQERAFVLPYLLRSRGESGKEGLSLRLMDSSKQFMRISYNMADVGTDSLHRVLDALRLGVDSIMEGRDEKVFFTGNSLMFLRGNQYLVRSLAGSILLAVLLIALMMGLTYRSWKAVLFALLPNSLPLLFPAGVMGWMGVSIKPSTVLIFSIVLGIAVDDCIHYLARYYQEIKRHNRSTMEHLRVCTLETGGSMIYTSIILFFGFVVFAFSDFGGTQALGLMSAVTLLLAMVANLVLLPTLILWMDRWKRPGSAVQP